MPTAEISISSMRTVDEAAAFRALNAAWIHELFDIEPQDLVTMDNPQAIVDQGGDVLIARADDGRIVGCVALVPEGHGVFELSKMAVDATERGHGFGRRLMEAAIARARELGATSIFLGSNHRLVAAVTLYESVGFRYVPREQIGPLPYTRADVFMTLAL